LVHLQFFHFVSYSAYNIAADYYKQYEDSMTETDAVNFFDQTISSQNTGHTFMALTISFYFVVVFMILTNGLNGIMKNSL